MKRSLSLEFINMPEEDRICQTKFTEVRSAQSVSSDGCDYV